MNRISSSISKLIFTLAAIAIIAVPSMANEVTIAGSTTGASTFNRPDVGAPPTIFSGVIVPYLAFQVNVSANDFYTFRSTSLTGDYDPFLVLYRGSFDPASLSTSVIANDDLTFGDFTQSGFTVALNQSFTYFIVQTGAASDDFGSFALTVDGPGTITLQPFQAAAIPEPGTMLLLGTGLAGIGATIRKRRNGNRNHDDTENRDL